ncbi:MAG: hypothetical protein WB780_04165 [Candidatus Acidiferrales bacterium]
MGNPLAVTLESNTPSFAERIAAQAAQAPPKAAAGPANQATAPAAQPAAQPVQDKVTISAAAQTQAAAQVQPPAQAAHAPVPAQVAAQAPAPAAAQPQVLPQRHVPIITQIRDLSRQGESTVQIANKLGLSQQDVASYLGVTLAQQ